MRRFLRAFLLVNFLSTFYMNAFSSDEHEEDKIHSHKIKHSKIKKDETDNLFTQSAAKTKRRKLDNKNEEAFLPSDLPGFTKLSANQYQCDDAQFDVAFPLCDTQSANKAVGQIETTNGTLGTGTIIEILKQKNKIKIKGITAKHVLFDNNKPVFGGFTQALIGAGVGKVTSLCKYTINEILTHPDNRDIALFKAETTLKKDLDKLLQTTIPSIVKSKSTSKQALIYHYPMGVQEQRKNKGIINSGVAHLVTTLPGSSGAAILNSQKKIIGIHVTSGNQNKKKVKYNGNKLPHIKGQKFGVSNENEYISITESDLNTFTVQHKK